MIFSCKLFIVPTYRSLGRSELVKCVVVYLLACEIVPIHVVGLKLWVLLLRRLGQLCTNNQESRGRKFLEVLHAAVLTSYATAFLYIILRVMLGALPSPFQKSGLDYAPRWVGAAYAMLMPLLQGIRSSLRGERVPCIRRCGLVSDFALYFAVSLSLVAMCPGWSATWWAKIGCAALGTCVAVSICAEVEYFVGSLFRGRGGDQGA